MLNDPALITAAIAAAGGFACLFVGYQLGRIGKDDAVRAARRDGWDAGKRAGVEDLAAWEEGFQAGKEKAS